MILKVNTVLSRTHGIIHMKVQLQTRSVGAFNPLYTHKNTHPHTHTHTCAYSIAALLSLKSLSNTWHTPLSGCSYHEDSWHIPPDQIYLGSADAQCAAVSSCSCLSFIFFLFIYQRSRAPLSNGASVQRDRWLWKIKPITVGCLLKQKEERQERENSWECKW